MIQLHLFSVPCNVTPCNGSNTECTNNADVTRTCSCIASFVPTVGNDPDNGCSCKYA